MASFRTITALTVISGIWIPLWLIFFRNEPAQSGFVSDAELKHIRGGVDAERDAWPWFVSLNGQHGTHMCSGSLV